MAFNIPREQQKLFIEQFMSQALAVALQMTEQGKDKGSPGATLYAVGRAIIAQLRNMDDTTGVDYDGDEESDGTAADDGNGKDRGGDA